MDEQLRELRYSLLAEFCRLPQEGDVISWQRNLADAIITAERQAKDLSKDRRHLKEHRHLLRVIGDSLVYTLLPSHTIRTLSEDPGPPASLTGQGINFEFVMDTAQHLSRRGYVPIVCDLTTLLNVGDIVGWRSDDIIIVECKNTDRPSRLQTSGRLARQRERGERVETYLRESRLIVSPELTKVATPATLPTPHWDSVKRLLNARDNSEQGIAVASLGHNDYLLAVGSELSDIELLGSFLPDASTRLLPTMAPYGELIDCPGYTARPPSCYPLELSERSRLLERDVFLIRLVDMAGLNAEVIRNHETIRLQAEREHGAFRVKIGPAPIDDLSFSPSLIDWCIWNPIPISAMRDYLIEYAALILDSMRRGDDLESLLPIAEGDNVLYGTFYKDDFKELSASSPAAAPIVSDESRRRESIRD